MKALNEEEYVQSKGTVCPFCKSTDISPYRKDDSNDPAYIMIPCHCLSCSSEWLDMYQLVGYEYLET